MTTYKCKVCGHLYNEEKDGIKWYDLPDDWSCPVCGAKKSMFKLVEAEESVSKNSEAMQDAEESQQSWKKTEALTETHFNEIKTIASTGKSIQEPMRTQKSIISWDDILIKGAQLARIPMNKTDPVNTQTIIGPKAKHPLIIDTPIYISHMSFGALSKEMKTALAKGSAEAKTLICSGEGGILPEEFNQAYKYIFEYVPNEYSVNKDTFNKVDAIEIKIGQSVKPGMASPAHFKDILSKEDLRKKVDWLREQSDGKPIGIKIAAGNIEDDLEVIIYANPDFITIDGRGGATGSAPKFIKDSTSVPTIFALFRTRNFLDSKGIDHISLIITGGLRISSDFAKAIAMGADAIAIATAAMIAGGCQQYRICHTGKCPMGIATQNPKLRSRFNIDKSSRQVANYLKICTEELKMFTRITGNNNIHDLSLNNLCTTNSEISDNTDIKHA
jgi:glutamate synthase domain-containing protein 2